MTFLNKENADSRLLVIIKNINISRHIHKVSHQLNHLTSVRFTFRQRLTGLGVLFLDQTGPSLTGSVPLCLCADPRSGVSEATPERRVFGNRHAG